ncbi:PAS domain S-box protein [Leptospira wolffii]|uniref:PAS domain-containing sensor histidine kinase n=1 Tax=Leptospira wolffii TaxID=409998 RepID=UPI0010844E30|nr:ATP-binding protein [Leptospira wolffii]TGK61611.1 PAS domain S-box protein [Leptospira wolffii]TGK70155.1 PAS domain S-box protein [Leptospira wolffii]TGK77078.1 PAS domain S-box protein [Leptospira wolffii]TGL31070.1 PAS domain S-box protein [Leptospira wolffii]
MIRETLRKILSPPIYMDAEKAVSVRLLYGLMTVSFSVSVLFRIVHPFVADKPKDTYYSFYIIPSAVLFCHALAKFGRIKLGTHILVFLQWLALSIVMLRETGVYAVAFSLFMVVITLSSLLLGNWVALAYTVGSILVGFCSVYFRMHGWIKPLPPMPGEWAVLTGNAIGFFMILILLRFGLGGFKKVREELSKAHIGAKLGSWSLDTSNLELTLSKEYRILLGETKARESVSMSFDSFLSTYVEEEEREKLREILANARRNREDRNFSVEFIYRAKGADGKIRYILTKGKYNDSFMGFGTGQDITEKHIAEEDLKTSQELFSKVFKLSPYATSISNYEDGKYLDINDGFTKMFGYTREDAVGTTSVELGLWPDPEVRDRYKEKIIKEGVLLNEETFFRAKDGRLILSEFSSRFVVIDGTMRMINIVKDISARKEAEELRSLNNEISARNELIAAQKKELESTLDNLKKAQNQLILSEKMAALGQLVAGIAHEINNPIGVIRAANESVKSHFHRSMERMEDAASIISRLNEKSKEDFQSLIRKGRYHKDILPPKEARAKTKILEAKLKDLGIAEARNLAEGLVDVGLESALEDYPRLFTGKHTKEVLQYAVDEIQASRSSNLIEMSVDRTSKIVYALKNFSHFSGGGPKSEVNLFESVDTVLTIYQNQLKSGIEIVKDYETLPPIQAYSDDLLHVWTNLIYNAIQAMEYKGTLKIGIQKSGDSETQVWISDSGPGIPENIQPRIFEPFFTTKAPGEGSGLGLDIAKRIVENHGGTIRFETSPNGTTFFVNLPN